MFIATRLFFIIFRKERNAAFRSLRKKWEGRALSINITCLRHVCTYNSLATEAVEKISSATNEKGLAYFLQSASSQCASSQLKKLQVPLLKIDGAPGTTRTCDPLI